MAEVKNGQMQKVSVINIDLPSQGIKKGEIVMLTGEQAEFLRMFAVRQYEGADDNQCTRKPIHIVQDVVYSYVTYHKDLDNGELPVHFYYGNRWYEDETEVVKTFLRRKGGNEDGVVIYERLFGQWFDDFGRIDSYEDYFRFFGVDSSVDVLFAVPQWENKAFFFIWKSATDYLVYQAHNLKKPRIYTQYFGYGNDGEYEPFYDLLMDMGKALAEGAESAV